jgi:hypothetical protein
MIYNLFLFIFFINILFMMILSLIVFFGFMSIIFIEEHQPFKIYKLKQNEFVK